jgi:pyruvate/2-oxoglutarate dehydrogenase complex dihydrolipoamide dehydrogenase (E3) component
MANPLTPDICVIGAGSGGLTVAAAAAAFGVPVVLVEKGRMGGDCLNYGCVPSKALLAAARHVQHAREAKAFGVLGLDDPQIDMRRVNDHVRAVIAAIAPNDSEERFTALGVHVIRAPARFVDGETVTVGGHTIRARRYVVATGSSPQVPPIPGLDSIEYFTNETIFENRRKLPHLLIIGGGPVGLEMAQAHRRLGSAVTVIEAFGALGKDDPEMAAIVLDRLRQEGIVIREHTRVAGVERRGKTGVRLVVESEAGESAIDGSDLLVAAGRAANVEGLGLEAAKIAFDRTGIKVDGGLRTTNKRVYAIGDVVGGPQFTHVASYHAGIVIRSLLFRLPAKADHAIVPWVTFTDPELAQAGLTEEAARNHHRAINILRWPYHENDRAQAERLTQGHVKVVADTRGRILGATIAGASAGELIHVWALAIARKMRLRDLAGYVPPYPTLGEINRRAALSHFAPYARRPFVRWLVGFLRRFG